MENFSAMRRNGIDKFWNDSFYFMFYDDMGNTPPNGQNSKWH